jgi:hypothetical protein
MILATIWYIIGIFLSLLLAGGILYISFVGLFHALEDAVKAGIIDSNPLKFTQRNPKT